MSGISSLIQEAENFLSSTNSSNITYEKIKEFFSKFLLLVEASQTNQQEFINYSLFSILWAFLPSPFELNEENLKQKIPSDFVLHTSSSELNLYTNISKFIDERIPSNEIYQKIFNIEYEKNSFLQESFLSLTPIEQEKIYEIIFIIWCKLCRQVLLNKSTCNKLICNLSLKQFMRLINVFLTYTENESITFSCCSLIMVLASDNSIYQEYIGKVLAFDVDVYNQLRLREKEELAKANKTLQSQEEIEQEMTKVEQEHEKDEKEEEEEEKIILNVPSFIYHKVFSLFSENEKILDMACRTLRNLSINDQTSSYLITACNVSQCLNDFLKLYAKKNKNIAKKCEGETTYSLSLLESVLYALINLSYDQNISLILGSEGLCMNLVEVMITFKENLIDPKLKKLSQGSSLTIEDRESIQTELSLVSCFLWLLKNLIHHNQNLRLFKFTTVIEVIISFRLYYGAIVDKNEHLKCDNHEGDMEKIYEEISKIDFNLLESTNSLEYQRKYVEEKKENIALGESFVDFEFFESYLGVINGLLNQGELGHEFISNVSLNYIDFFIFLYKTHIIKFKEITRKGPLTESLLFSLYNLIHNAIVVVPLRKIKKKNINQEELAQNDELINKIKEKLSQNGEDLPLESLENFKILEEVEYEHETNPTAVEESVNTQTPLFSYEHTLRLKTLFSTLTSIIHDCFESYNHLEAMSELLAALVHLLSDGSPYNISLFQSYNTVIPLCKSLNTHQEVPETVVKLWKTLLVLLNFKKSFQFDTNTKNYEDVYKNNLKEFIQSLSSSSTSPLTILKGSSIVKLIRKHKDYGEVWSFGLHLLLALHPFSEEELKSIEEKGYLKKKKDDEGYEILLSGEPDLVEKAFFFDDIVQKN